MRNLLVCLLMPVALSAADPGPFSAFNKLAFTTMKTWVVASAEKMPEENYSFKPTDTVRSFGQVVGHVADSQYMLCSAVLGDKTTPPKIEQAKFSKADLVAALKTAFAYCDKAYDTITDASATQTVKFMGGDMAKPVVLTVNDMHLSEHYGNLVTYLRMKNIVPPSTEQDSPPQPKK